MPQELPSPAEAAERLEQQADGALLAGDLVQAARCLNDASLRWAQQGQWMRQGASGLLAASLWRRAGRLQEAGELLAVLAASALPPKLARGVVLEACEQHLAAGRPREALRGFNDFWARFQSQLESSQRPEVLQRRAAAAWTSHAWGQAAEDLQRAAALSVGPRAGACILLAVQALARVDGAAARRLRLQATGGPQEALAAATLAMQWAVQLGDTRCAYACLAEARADWASRLSAAEAQTLFEPALHGLRQQLGDAAFLAARTLFDAAGRGLA